MVPYGEGSRQSDSGARLPTHLNLVPRLRMSGAVPMRPIYALMASTRTTNFAWAISMTKGTE
jgi:hypothetical protein